VKDYREIEPGVWSVLNGHRSYEVRISGDQVRVNGRPIEVKFEDPREWNPRASRGALHGGAQVHAPMPGKVVKVLVAVGDDVESGQGVVVVEAMKMQNELKSPRAGRVAAVSAQANQTVNAGTVLVTIE
jgi:biotin carboxyl carrier protein